MTFERFVKIWILNGWAYTAQCNVSNLNKNLFFQKWFQNAFDVKRTWLRSIPPCNSGEANMGKNDTKYGWHDLVKGKEDELLTDSLCMKAIFWSVFLMHSKLPFCYYIRRIEPSLWHNMVLSKMYYLLSNIFSPYFWWSGDPFYTPAPDRARSPVRKITLQTWQLGHWYLRHAKMPT